MLEIFKRLFISPVLLAELLILSLIVNVLALASPLFVMQVLSRYITSGVDSTLQTLVFGYQIGLGRVGMLHRHSPQRRGDIYSQD